MNLCFDHRFERVFDTTFRKTYVYVQQAFFRLEDLVSCPRKASRGRWRVPVQYTEHFGLNVTQTDDTRVFRILVHLLFSVLIFLISRIGKDNINDGEVLAHIHLRGLIKLQTRWLLLLSALHRHSLQGSTPVCVFTNAKEAQIHN